MVDGWSVDIGAEAGALTNYSEVVDLSFVRRLNGLGTFNLFLSDLGGGAVPTRGQVARIVWDKGLSSERVHFEGYIQDVRQHGNVKAFRLRGFDVLGKLWQSGLGGFRDWRSKTPFSIIQGAGPPNNLLTNAQGTVAMTYGSAAGVPFKVDGVNPGTALNFRADSAKMLVNIQRLAIQARYDGATFGLEFLARFEGANNSDPRFYLVKRRNRADPYTPEVFNIPGDFVQARRGFEGITAAQAVRVVGSGDGTQRVQSSIVGSGGLEGILSDKSVVDATAAGNMANRLSNLLNPATEVVTGRLLKHTFATEPGDDVTVTEDGVANATLRCFEVGYSLPHRSFFLTLGRPRPNREDPFFGALGILQSQAQSYQHTSGAKVNATQPATATNAALGNNATLAATLSFTAQDFQAYRDEGVFVWLEIIADAAGDWGIELSVSPDGALFNLIKAERINTDAGYWACPVTLPNEIFQEPFGMKAMTAAELKVINRTGANRNVTIRLRAWVMT